MSETDNRINCEDTRQKIAANQKLSDDELLHVYDCDACKLFLLESNKLERLVTRSINLRPSADFSTRVMQQIHHISAGADTSRFEESPVKGWLSKLALSAGLLIGVLNIIRYLLAAFLFGAAAAL